MMKMFCPFFLIGQDPILKKDLAYPRREHTVRRGSCRRANGPSSRQLPAHFLSIRCKHNSVENHRKVQAHCVGAELSAVGGFMGLMATTQVRCGERICGPETGSVTTWITHFYRLNSSLQVLL